MQIAVIALGSNATSTFEEVVSLLCDALGALFENGLSVEKVSRIYRTPCFPKGAGPDFANAAIRVATNLTADELLALLHKVESDFGRQRTVRWGQRTLDLDLVFYGDAVMPDEGTLRAWMDLPLADQMSRAPEELLLPHPRLQDRAFVLVPVADIAADWRHPILDKTVAQLLAALPPEEVSEVVPVDLAESACKSGDTPLCQWLPRTTS